MIEYPCGCKFEENEEGFPIFNPNVEALPLECTATWDMICEGNTKGVFQLESQLGQSKAREVKPKSVEELSDLIAIIRPGCGDAIVDGKSLTQHYIDRKAGRDEVVYFHPLLKEILESTQGILVYQEQAMQIAQKVAGFTLQQADALRKAIGKKKVELMAQVKQEFLDGAEALGEVTKKDAEEIFSWIEKSQKYSFNKSHSISYAMNGYQTAYAKAHFPREFFTSYLMHSDGKPKPFLEISDLVNNARAMDIDVLPPNFLNMNSNFRLINNNPTFGLVNIKSVGQSVYDKIVKMLEEKNIDPSTLNWDQFLMRLGLIIKKDSFTNMIKAGALDYLKVHRNKMLYDFSIYEQFSNKHHIFLSENSFDTLEEGILALIEHVKTSKKHAHTAKHIEMLESSITSLKNPPFKLVDFPSWRAKQERDLLGIEITCHDVDEYDLGNANCTCREYVKGFDSKIISIAAKVDDIREWKIRGGQNKGQVMAFLKIGDGSSALDSATIFADDYKRYKDKLAIDKIFLFKGERDKKRGSFLIKKIQKLERCI